LEIDQILGGLGAPATTAIPDSVVGYDDSLEPYYYDLDLAISYVEDAGYTVLVTHFPTETGITALVFLSFLVLTALEALRRFRKK
jgi:ABC-type transport system substrate-binding protein